MKIYDPIVYLNPSRGPGVFIAGGAIRDVLFNKPVKDLDVFQIAPAKNLSDHASRGVTHYVEADHLTGWDWGNKKGGIYFELTEDPSTYGSTCEFYSFHSEQAPGVNLIMLPTTDGLSRDFVSKVLEKFPVSISQVAYIPYTDELVYTEEFKKSAETKVIKYDSGSYANRIHEKYRDGDWSWENKYRW